MPYAWSSQIARTQISMSSHIYQQVTFLLDTMLGRLCRWLRCLGVDAQVAGHKTTRQELTRLATQVCV